MPNTIIISFEMHGNQIRRHRRIAITLLLTAYSAALSLLLLATLPLWARELRRNGKYREGFLERLGQIPRTRLAAPPPAAQVVWVHAVSVGELLAAGPLIDLLTARSTAQLTSQPHDRPTNQPSGPSTNQLNHRSTDQPIQTFPAPTPPHPNQIAVYISTTTRTAQAIARQRFGPSRVFYLPTDFAFAIRPWLRFLQPALIVLLESELWPRLLTEAARAQVPVAIINGRISTRSWPRYQRLRCFWRLFLPQISLVHAQTPDDAARFAALGAPNALATGNLKFDLPIPTPTPLQLAITANLPISTPVIVCGSTLAGEESLLLQAIPPGTITLLAPRHPDRFPEVAALLDTASRPWLRLSVWRSRPSPIHPGTILLLDSVGELAPLYALATVAVVGGGFLHTGGHNPLEPAILGKPIILGPGFTNFRAIVHSLLDADAIRIAAPDADPTPDAVPNSLANPALHSALNSAISPLAASNAASQSLSRTLQALLDHPSEAAALGTRARSVCALHAGATARASEAILRLLAAQSPPEPRP